MDIPRSVASSESSCSDVNQTALRLLLEAHTCAHTLGVDSWDFAVALADLQYSGVTGSAARWLICKGYVEHSIERTRATDPRRVFKRIMNLALSECSCFVLTQAGFDFARRVCACGDSVPAANGFSRKTEEHNGTEHPHWNESLHTLFWRGQALKQFKSDAPNQETILREFQAHDWCPCIPVILPNDDGINPKDRLHDTIKNLNRGVQPFLRFSQEGCGSRVRWEAIHPNGTSV